MHFLMRRLVHPQLPFQRYRGRTFLLEPILIGQLEDSHTLRRQFREHVGLDEHTFIDLAAALQAPLQRGSLNLDLSGLAAQLSYPGADVAAFLAFVGRSPNALVDSPKRIDGRARRSPAELVEFPVIARYPFLRDGNTFRCWHPRLYHHGIADSVHEAPAEVEGQHYIERYGKVLEKHVVSLAKNAGDHWIDETRTSCAGCFRTRARSPRGCCPAPTSTCSSRRRPACSPSRP